MSIDMEFRARVSGAISNTDKLMKKVVQLEERLKKLGRTQRKNSQQQSAFSRGAISQVRQLAVSYLGFQGVLRGVNKVFGDLEARSLAAGETTLGLAQAEANFMLNTAGLAADQLERLKKGMEGIASEGLQRRVLFPAAGAAVSGSGGLPIEQVIAGLKISSKFAAAGEEATRELTSALFDVKRAIPEFSVAESAGFVAQTAQFARIQEIGKTGRGIAKSLTSLVRQGFSAERAQALFITGSLAGSDPQGRLTSRAVLEFGAKLDLLFKGMPNQTTFRERFKFMELHPRAQRKWAELTASSFAIQFRQPFQQIFTQGSFSNTLMKKTIKQIENSGATTEGRLQALQTLIDRIGRSNVQQAAKLDRTMKAAIEETVLGQTDVGRLGIIRKEGEKLMRQVMPGGFSASAEVFISKQLMNIQELVGDAPDTIALGFLRRIHKQAVSNDTVTKGLLKAIKQQISQVSPAEMMTIGDETRRGVLQDFIDKMGGRMEGSGMAGGDMEHFLERHRRLFWGGKPQFKQSEILEVAKELKRFVDTQISKEEIQAATLTQQRELALALKDLAAFLRRRARMPVNPNTHIENR